jgi:hypothetical protein
MERSIVLFLLLFNACAPSKDDNPLLELGLEINAISLSVAGKPSPVTATYPMVYEISDQDTLVFTAAASDSALPVTLMTKVEWKWQMNRSERGDFVPRALNLNTRHEWTEFRVDDIGMDIEIEIPVSTLRNAASKGVNNCTKNLLIKVGVLMYDGHDQLSLPKEPMYTSDIPSEPRGLKLLLKCPE